MGFVWNLVIGAWDLGGGFIRIFPYRSVSGSLSESGSEKNIEHGINENSASVATGTHRSTWVSVNAN